ncbi:urease subunit beta [Brachybacterium saurashtrense]|uniref:Urease subunit beta n=1 Tax=Brachybacterium saurashtrense TaxID=556288 RepID=A0A345YJX4_9MICO|nr:urease subunit beta [Brachybacterium saurashtrense]AXK44226.1 urease subunit beta [Brachybacterium saurashtrense]RRR21498.1 urease subunit beta [Brachybacterium saurashtrense]
MSTPDPALVGPTGPGAIRVRPGTRELNHRADPADRIELVLENTGDRPVQIGSHLHLPDANEALAMDREAARGFRLDVPAGTSLRFEPGASRTVAAVRLGGAGRVPGLQIRSVEGQAR